MTITTVFALALFISAPTSPAPRDVKTAVATGLACLAKLQKPDGSWSDPNVMYPTYVTANAGVALLMEGSTLVHGTYAPNLRQALAWMEKNAAAGGRIGGAGRGEPAWDVGGHSDALIFLICVHEVDDDEPRRERVAKLLDRAITFLVHCQADGGGWGYASTQKSDDKSYPTIAALQALFAAQKAGFTVPKRTIERGVGYLVTATSRNGGVRFSAGAVENAGGDSDGVATASAAAGLMMSDGARPAALAEWVKHAREISLLPRNDLFTNSNAMAQYYSMARVAYCLGEAGHSRLAPTAADAELVKWSAYKKATFKALTGAQGADGSWPDPYLGPAHSTAHVLIVLQLDNGYLPAFSR